MTKLYVDDIVVENPTGVATSVAGKTGDVTLVKGDVGLANVDNTSDAAKPVSTAQQAALDLKYNASNPAGYETPAQLNARDTANRSRANHTGTQAASTISDFAAAADARIAAQKAVANGLATLDALGAIPPEQIDLKNQGATASGSITTTSTTDVLMTGMTTTPPAGTYVVLFGTSVTHSTNGATITGSIYAGGVQAPESERTAQPRSGNNTFQMMLFTWAIVTVNGSQAIEGRWRTSAATATAPLRRTLTAIRIS